ncbi:MAG TPA: DNA helicase RecQ [Burkholderiaceae bacterium]|nr:DNA helicase RecQ [Burkholderiaceae bacterium]
MDATASLRDQARDLLARVFGYDTFRGFQEDVIIDVASGHDAFVLMPTGGGKSICYQLPALLRGACGVVVSPLIALMHDQVDALAQLGVRAAALNSSMSLEQSRATEAALLRGELDLLYVAPERLLTPRFLDLLERAVQKNRVALYAIDEAHCVSQWGHDFRPEYRELTVLHERWPRVPRIALTATADERTRAEIVERLELGEAHRYVASFDRPNIRYRIVEKIEPRKQLLDFLRNEHRDDAGIVYCLSRKKVEDTAAWLNAEGRPALPYHAGLDTEVRTRHQRRFLREEGLVMVATVAFGMGIDKPDVRFVAHLDLPKNIEAYYQETGRAGRDGAAADAWLCYGLQDVVQQRRMIEQSDASDEHKRVETRRLNHLLALCETTRCRRQVLLAYFGEQLSAPCGNCDNCIEPAITWDATEAARKALSNVYRIRQASPSGFGAGHLIDVLLGKANERIHSLGHDRLTTFGIGKELDARGWGALHRQLIVSGMLEPEGEYGVLRLTEAGRAWLKSGDALHVRASTLRAKTSRTTNAPKAATAADVPAAHQPLFDALRSWRREIAQTQQVPPYVVFHDSVLKAIAALRPSTLTDLAAISGVGTAKLDRYGKDVLALVASNS